MADFTANTTGVAPQNLILRVLGKIWAGLIYIGEQSARARMAQALAELSDEELAAHGLTRADLAKRIFTDGYHL